MAVVRRVRPGEVKPFKRRDGLLAAAVSFRDPSGKRQKHFVYGRDALEVARKHAEMSMLHGITPDSSMVFGAWLERYMRDHHQAQRLSHSTLVNYRTYLKRILPALGGVRLSELTPLVMRSFFESTSDLSSSTRQHMFNLLNAALKDAVNVDILEKNPMRGVERPRSVQHRETRPWESTEIKRIAKAFMGHRLEALPLVGFTLGLRIGEVLALTWDDLRGDVLDVHRTLNIYYKAGAEPFRPAKAGSVRVLTLPPDMCAVLEAHRVRQMQESLSYGEGWNPFNLVFCSLRGTPLNQQNFARIFKAKVKAAGVRWFGTHAMRKSYATLAAAANLPITDVQRRLGHSDPRMTLKVYARSLATRQKQTAVSLIDLLKAGDEE